MIPSLTGWELLFGRLAVQAGLWVALVVLAGRWVKTVQWRRLMWQSTFVGVALVWAVELSGGRGWLPGWPQHRPIPASTRVVKTLVADEVPVHDASTTVEVPVSGTSDSNPSVTTPWWPGLVWLMGLGGVLMRSLGSRVCLAWRVHTVRGARATLVDGESAKAVERIRKAIGLGPVDLRVLPGLRGPVAFGIVRPTVAVPADFEDRFPTVQREAMLAHELGHLARRDPLWLLVADLVYAVGWWHPALWWARRQFRAACEVAADDVSTLVPGGRMALAEALVGLGRELTSPGGIGVGGSGLRSDLARRVKVLVGRPGELGRIQARGRWMFRFGLTALVFGLLLIPWPGAHDGLGAILAAARAEQATIDRPSKATPASLPASTVGGIRVGVQPSPATTPDPALANKGRSPAATPSDGSEPQVLLSVFLIEITDRGSSDLGLDWLFGQSVTNNPPLISEQHATHLPGTTETLKGGRLQVDGLTVEGQSAVISGEQFAALKARLNQRDGVDFMTTPKVATLSGRQAHISICDVMTMVTGVEARDASATNQADVHYLTEAVPVGPSVHLIPTAEGDSWRVGVLASVTEFLGYDQPARSEVKADKGKSLSFTIPLPRLRVRKTQSVAKARNGEVIALRGPMTERVIQFKDKVPVLGDIPLLGRLFREESRQTHRSRLYVFVQPETINSQGSKSSGP